MPVRQWSIAVIDDDESMCHALARMLRVAGYQVQTYYSAEAFIEDPAHLNADFLVADIQLRGMSAFDLTRRLREGPKMPPVALITAHDESEVRDQARAAGCVVYLRKPFPASLLIGAVKSVLDHPEAGPPGQFPQFTRKDPSGKPA